MEQYLGWLGGMLHGNLGNSAVALAQHQPNPSIASTLKDPLINSLLLGGITAILLIPLTLLLGAAPESRPTSCSTTRSPLRRWSWPGCQSS